VPFFGVERQVNADVERGVAGGGLGKFQEPRAGHHDRARTADAKLHEFEEGGVGTVAHADIVFMQDDAAA
jgi:hypothetical protein